MSQRHPQTLSIYNHKLIILCIKPALPFLSPVMVKRDITLISHSSQNPGSNMRLRPPWKPSYVVSHQFYWLYCFIISKAIPLLSFHFTILTRLTSSYGSYREVSQIQTWSCLSLFLTVFQEFLAAFRKPPQHNIKVLWWVSGPWSPLQLHLMTLALYTNSGHLQRPLCPCRLFFPSQQCPVTLAPHPIIWPGEGLPDG